MPPIHINHNVYILGAGFSRDANLPLTFDFLTYMRDSLEWLSKDPSRSHEIKAIESVFDFMLKATSAAYRTIINVENIEELFSLASASEDDSLMDSLPTAIAATLDYARTKPEWPLQRHIFSAEFAPPSIWEEVTGWGGNEGQRMFSCSIYDIYAGLLSGRFCSLADGNMRNTIITFNYDTLLEDSFRAFQIPFNYGFPNRRWGKRDSPPDSFPILKLHGSVNWGLKSNGEGVNIYDSYTQVRSENEQPLLVPPTWRKTFGGDLTKVWKAALKALSEATRVIILGFSIPPTDVHFRFLLAAGLQNNISLRKIFFVNPCERGDEEENLFKIVHRELVDQKLIETCKKKTWDFLISKSQLGQIKRYPLRDLTDHNFH
jgi:hypothetical protein